VLPEADRAQALLEQLRAARPGLLDFVRRSGAPGWQRFDISFHLETLAPAVAAFENPVYVRSTFNRAQLDVPDNPDTGPACCTWLTPIFHPVLHEGYLLQAPGSGSQVQELLRLLLLLLEYRTVPGLPIESPEAAQWCKENQPRVAALQQHNRLLDGSRVAVDEGGGDDAA
jgi:hypothetical protein